VQVGRRVVEPSWHSCAFSASCWADTNPASCSRHPRRETRSSMGDEA
jgi:hypothetical protein